MQIAVASGKGGTGKTTVSVNLFHFIKKFLNKNVQLTDCDVEEPNDIFFLKNPDLQKKQEIFQLVPEINNNCTFCKKCEDWCEFSAITIVSRIKFAEVNEDLCHSCGACTLACNFNAITEKEISVGEVSYYKLKDGRRFTEGRLKVGSPMQTFLIRQLKKLSSLNDSITILDAPPGTSCPVVETISGSDLVILVTEPTPFGLYDLKLTVKLLNETKIPYGVIVNKAGLGSDEVYSYLEQNKIALLGEIPFSKHYAGLYASGKILHESTMENERIYREIINKISSLSGL